MIAPTYFSPADLAEGTGTRAFTAVATQPNDWIVVEVISDNNNAGTAVPVTCPGLTFLIQNTVNQASPGTHTFITQSSVQDTAGSASRVVTVTPSNANPYRAHLTVVHGSGGIGNKAINTTGQSVSLARNGNNSGVIETVGDWAAGAVGSPAWTPGGATITSQQGTGATYLFGRWDDSGPAGTATHGVSSPAYGTPSFAVLEMLGLAGTPDTDIDPYDQRGPGPGPWDIDFTPDPTSTDAPAGVTQVSQTLDLQWLSYASVSATLDARWAVLSTVSQTTDLRWAVLSSVSQTMDLQWRVSVQVSQTTDIRWRVSVLVSQTTDLRWAVLATVSQTTDLRWRSYAIVAQALDLRWLSYVNVAATTDLRWLVYSSVSQTSDLRWKVYVLVSQTTDLRWIVVSSSTPVSQTLDLRWLSYVGVVQASDLRWRVSELVSGTTDLRWAVRTIVAQTLSTPWAVLGVVAGTLDARWRVYVGMSGTHSQLWRVLALVQSDLELLWAQEETTLPVPAQFVFLGVESFTSYLSIIQGTALPAEGVVVAGEVHVTVDLRDTQQS